MKVGIVSVTLLLVLIFQGCASPRYRMIKEKKRTQPEHYYAAGGDEYLRTTLHHVVYQSSPGSWKKKAWWDEYIVELENLSGRKVVVETISIHADGYSENVFKDDKPWRLAKKSKSLARAYRNIGYNFAVIAGPGIATTVYIAVAVPSAASVGSLASLTGSLEAAAIAAPLTIGYWGVVGTKNMVNASRIRKEFNNRRIEFPLSLEPEANQIGSAFFTTVPSPQSLRIIYRFEDDPNDRRELLIATPFLYGLHLREREGEELVEVEAGE
ncbi:hypothetical protein VDG1235_1366 [Verrucomicrobiia bacterium DG1235]|nr:hypothetical protein VDG1235_1366 [Verrucomicrobiae bacterium DG1235]